MHWGQCRSQSNLFYACGGSDHYIRDCPQNADKSYARPLVDTNITPCNRNSSETSSIWSSRQRQSKPFQCSDPSGISSSCWNVSCSGKRR
ncbi:hypothetical protein V6N12_062349 [Hibiscus sabdariffa]|uniref:CCHC-type domain-containing protein n=1 Tax=Hibiscus sabdariffa TaxID=183260 RepID=A0ABR2F8K3_9ROSI